MKPALDRKNVGMGDGDPHNQLPDTSMPGTNSNVFKYLIDI